MKKFIVFDNPWSMMLPASVMGLILSIISMMQIADKNYYTSIVCPFSSLILMLMSIYYWLRDVTRESFLGSQINSYVTNVKLAMILFLISEGFLFFSFFWTFLYTSAIPESNMWPPFNLILPSTLGAPTLNTILLVASSATVTMSHYNLSTNQLAAAPKWLMTTLTLSFLFIMIQSLEYLHLPLNITSGIAGSTFFISTGFHGIHVIFGATSLSICFVLMLKKFFSKNSYLSYEMSIWYWHFVDAIWLLLFTLFYSWGS